MTSKKERRRKYYQEHREEAISYAKAWNDAHKDDVRKRSLEYYYRHREERIAYAKNQDKRNIKHNGKVILRNVDKPSKPTLCELCNQKSYLAFHHWEDSKPEVGLWICNRCHTAVHCLINRGELEAKVESQMIVRSLLGFKKPSGEGSIS